MKRRICVMLLAVMAFCAAAGWGEPLYVDNRETDKVYPERLNLRAEPSKNGAIMGLYYTGTQVEALAVEDAFTQVSVGGVSGYMASEYLITAQEAVSRYGEGSTFGEGRAARIHLGGLWETQINLLAAPEQQAQTLRELHHGDAVQLLGILGDEWAYVAVDAGEKRQFGYLPLHALIDVLGYEAMIVAGEQADSRTVLYDAPNNQAQSVMDLKNGTACFALFGRKEGNWVKVRVGGVSGWIKYTQAANLELIQAGGQRSIVPYYPLVMQTRSDALLRSSVDDETKPYMTLGAQMQVEVLAECGEYVYVRTMEGGAGAYDCGDYGYMHLSDLMLAEAAGGVGLAQADDGDLPVALYAAPDEAAACIGALIPGAQVQITDFTQTDYLEVSLAGMKAYVRKSQVRALGDGAAPSQRIPQRASALGALTLLTLPQEDAQAALDAGRGDRLYMLAMCGEWAFVQKSGQDDYAADETLQGFVKCAKISAPASTTHLIAGVTMDKVNMREQADKLSQIVARARLGDMLRVAEYGNDWCCVETPEGKRGYIMTQYLVFE